MIEICADITNWPTFQFDIKSGSFSEHEMKHHSLVKSTQILTVEPTFYRQVQCCLNFYSNMGIGGTSGSLRKPSNKLIQEIPLLIKEDLLQKEEFYLPYVGRFRVVNENGKIVFSPAKILSDRVKGIAAKEHRVTIGRLYGGEGSPKDTIPLWGHLEISQQSRRRQFVARLHPSVGLSLRNSVSSLYRFIGLSIDRRGTCYLKGIGTIRSNPSKIIFSNIKVVSRSMEKSMKHHQKYLDRLVAVLNYETKGSQEGHHSF